MSRIYYVTRGGYTPYFGEWQEWIEPLDEFGENEPSALRLLARYSGGVYVVRRAGAIAGYAGIRTHSPRVAEISVRTAALELRGQALGRAVVSRATKAVFASGRVPIYRCGAGNAAATRVAASLGYRFYADAVTISAQL
jgi:predicted GNAT family acetyltransferase